MRVERLRLYGGAGRPDAGCAERPAPSFLAAEEAAPGATDLRCAPAAAATSGSECKGSSSSPALSGLQSAHLQTLLDSPRALSSFAAQLSPRLAEMYGVDFGAFLFDES